MKGSNVLVIIVTYNAMRWAKDCFDSLLCSTIPLDVFVVDNQSEDNTREFIKQNYPQFILYESSVNLKFGRGNNVGFKYALAHQYEYVYLLNQDAWIKPNTVELLMEQSRQHPDYGILSPLQLQRDESTFENIFHDWCFNERLCSNILADTLLGHTKGLYETKFIMAAHWFMSISCIERIGGFSPSFVHGAEDNNYIERVRFHGLKIGIVPASVGIHDSQTLKKDNSISSNYLNLVQYISNPQGVNYRLIFRTMLTTVHFVFIYKTFSPLKNIFKFMKNKRQFDENRRLSQQGRAFL